ncbi:hypothetical protein [Maridesulfovibrio sp.]|uniref:hypothetical protein n=1 Tax=Maridesulfovibrio sp. TaxID=2795000 RepID=UPI002AA72D88|nr:hypothetical protein [Maridesulfovibrio sp.]
MKNKILQNLGDQPWCLKSISNSFLASYSSTKSVIRDLQGFKVLEAIYDLKKTHALLKSCVDDLMIEIGKFEQTEYTPTWNDVGTDFEKIRFNVSKAVFSTASSASALRDLQNVIKDKYADKDEFNASLLEVLDGSHISDFVFSLRNYSVHRCFLLADWQYKYDFEGGPNIRNFLLKKDRLLQFKKWNAGARTFINRCEEVDVKTIFQEYIDKVNIFNDWVVDHLQSKWCSEIDEYARYEKMIFCVDFVCAQNLSRQINRARIPAPFTEEEIELMTKHKFVHENALAALNVIENIHGYDILEIVFKTKI